MGQVTVFTSRTEGFGRTILEAEAAGTPVISYDIDYGPRAIVGKAGKLVADGDVNALANAIVMALADSIKRVEDMIAAVVKAHKQNRDINLQLYGTVSDQAYYTQLQQQVADAHATGYITFNGATTDAISTFETGFRNLLRAKKFDWIVTGTQTQAIDLRTEWGAQTVDIAPASVTVPDAVTDLADRRAMSVVVVTRFDHGMLHVLSFEAMVKYFLDKLTAEEPSVMYADVLEETMTQAYGSVENAEMKVAYIHADHHVAHHQILALHDARQVTIVDKVFNQHDELVGEIYYGLDNKSVSRRVAILYNRDGSERMRLLYVQNKVTQVLLWDAWPIVCGHGTCASF
ncbi:glycosyltransferase family 4 protein [Weissella confusa]|uniref:Glycosyltransferase family 4 protein n=1 Tax=Weissella confusa TaxID=1583 RepID=A0A923SP69_WEICO|nr:glycosyltransferase family 4 protein [Weissella confusa]